MWRQGVGYAELGVGGVVVTSVMSGIEVADGMYEIENLKHRNFWKIRIFDFCVGGTF